MPRYTFLDSYNLTRNARENLKAQTVPAVGLGYASNFLRAQLQITATTELDAIRENEEPHV